MTKSLGHGRNQQRKNCIAARVFPGLDQPCQGSFSLKGGKQREPGQAFLPQQWAKLHIASLAEQGKTRALQTRKDQFLPTGVTLAREQGSRPVFQIQW